jgi:SAM-dependent methyltransferase
MPRVARTIVPRIRKSIQQRGIWVSIGRSVLLPIHLIREYRDSRRLKLSHTEDRFDEEYGVDTAGEFDGWTYLSDLAIPSRNWIHGNDYVAIEPARFRAAMAKLRIQFEDFVFVDFGSGKGRALLMAAGFPFKRIVGVEFSPELHAIAQRNIQKYRSQTLQRPTLVASRVESVCSDFLDFDLPEEPSVYFFFDPCDQYVLGKLLEKISSSLKSHPRPVRLIYVAPTSSRERLLDACEVLTKAAKDIQHNFCIYNAG